MDKEKLLCEIDEYIHSIYECGRNKDGLYEKRQIRDAILHFAEPREKKIAEAKKIIKNLMVYVELDLRDYEPEYKEAEAYVSEVEE